MTRGKHGHGEETTGKEEGKKKPLEFSNSPSERPTESDLQVEGNWPRDKEERFVRIVDGWRRIDNRRGFMNATTGQNLVVTKKQYGEHYLALLFSAAESGDEGRRISPEFSTESKAAAFAMDWMNKHPRGVE